MNENTHIHLSIDNLICFFEFLIRQNKESLIECTALLDEARNILCLEDMNEDDKIRIVLLLICAAKDYLCLTYEDPANVP